MSKVILITGGSRSGKSSFGERLLRETDDVLYIATAIATDDEMKERIAVHKARRNSKWETYEGYRDLDRIIKESKRRYIMLECVTTMITNLMFDKYEDFDDVSREEIKILEETIAEQFKNIVTACREADKEIVIITNEVGFGLISEYRVGRIFTDIAGRINQQLARLSDEVYLLVSGLPLKLK